MTKWWVLLLVLALLLSLRQVSPGLFPDGIVPVREGELWEMNP